MGRPDAKSITFDFSSPRLYNSVYIPLFKDKTRYLHLFGSAGSGKSVFGFQREIVKTFDGARRNRKTLVVRRYAVTLFDSCFEEIRTRIDEFGLTRYFTFQKSPLRITNTLTNVAFIFKGLDDDQKIKSISGVDRIIVEECTEIEKAEYIDQLSTRLRGFSETQITLMYNPVNVWHWLSQNIHNNLPENHRLFKTTYKDNRFLDEAFIADLEAKRISNPNYYRVYGLGEWGQNLEGLIYPRHTVRPVEFAPQGYGLDFGYNEPCALVECAIVDQEADKKALRVRELLYETRHTSDTLIARLNAMAIDRRLPLICDNARPEMIEALKKAGYNAKPCEKGAGSVKAGIDGVMTYDLEIAAGSKNLLREIQNYVWLDKKGLIKDEPAPNQADHLLDAMRYWVRSVTSHKPGASLGVSVMR